MIPQQPEKGLHLGIILCADGRTPENDSRIETNAPHFYLYTISSLQDKCGIVSNFVPFIRITWNYKCHWFWMMMGLTCTFVAPRQAPPFWEQDSPVRQRVCNHCKIRWRWGQKWSTLYDDGSKGVDPCDAPLPPPSSHECCPACAVRGCSHIRSANFGGFLTSFVEFESLEKSKSRIKSEKSDLIFY